MKTKAGQPNKFIRIITTPFRALCKARDFYVRSMMNCANRNIVGLQGTSQTTGLPRSFSVSSARSSDTDEDYRELVRAASARNIGSRIDLDAYISPQAMPPRSISVAMGRIDEDRPCCYFGEDNVIVDGNKVVNVKSELKYPRSKSHAVTRSVF
ncbi:hypothetical protein PHJA_002685100 [Phtheirospermum japonicum]|uniref:Uncharacterized protein n=1 Tax=Phtheirospermum japonicum TaxID=374723 RepID=A0A830D2E4_9LAMI|nr:hypothetical protein PHJA_002685100 [Phtheirospermum japonicum]